MRPYAEIPEFCPQCGFYFVLRPEPKMRKRSLLLFLVGVFSVYPWVYYLLARLQIAALARSPRGLVVLFVLCGAPALVMGWIAMGMRRVATLDCPECGWSEQYTT